MRQYRVTPNPAAMLALGVTAAEIEAAIARFGTNSGGGFVDQQGREYLIRNLGLTQRLEDLRGTPVAQRAGQAQSVLLHQLAAVDSRQGRGGAMQAIAAPRPLSSASKSSPMPTRWR
ncbi:efflux RND transporter permease subunit [Siccirubricoccus deserti]